MLINVVVRQRLDLDGNAAICQAVQAAETELNGQGRVLLRASGAEPKVRVMVEGEQRLLVERLAHSVADVVRAAAQA